MYINSICTRKKTEEKSIILINDYGSSGFYLFINICDSNMVCTLLWMMQHKSVEWGVLFSIFIY